jgi:hypothetical protein
VQTYDGGIARSRVACLGSSMNCIAVDTGRLPRAMMEERLGTRFCMYVHTYSAVRRCKVTRHRAERAANRANRAIGQEKGRRRAAELPLQVVSGCSRDGKQRLARQGSKVKRMPHFQVPPTVRPSSTEFTYRVLFTIDGSSTAFMAVQRQEKTTSCWLPCTLLFCFLLVSATDALPAVLECWSAGVLECWSAGLQNPC